MKEAATEVGCTGNARGYYSKFVSHFPIIGKIMTNIIFCNHITIATAFPIQEGEY